MVPADTKFDFDLIFALPETPVDEAVVLDSLYEAGCDDAVVGLGESGAVGLGFSRAGNSAETVIPATVRQALRGLPDGFVLREVRRATASATRTPAPC